MTSSVKGDASALIGLGAIRLTVLLLALCQALSMTGNAVLATTSALVGHSLAPDKALATLPLALQLFATTAASVPVSLLMRRWGRRSCFVVGGVVGCFGAGVAAWAVMTGQFWLFCLGCIILGGYNATSLYYRFAAAETAESGEARFRSKAVSLVLAGGVIAAIVGPELARASKEWFGPVLFAGTYVTVAVLPLAVAALAVLTRIPHRPKSQSDAPARPLAVIMRQPQFIVALSGALIGNAVMLFVMTATPLAMAGCSLSFDQTAFVIQWHILGMFVPSFFTGHLVNRFGIPAVMTTGAMLLLVSIGINLGGVSEAHFWSALVLLGVGWNFLYIGSTLLLTRSYHPVEQAKTQAVNEFLVSGMAALASLSAGMLQYSFGWEMINLIALPPVLMAVCAIFAMMRYRRTSVV